MPKYERFAAKVLEDNRRGLSALVTKRVLGLDHVSYHDALHFAETGERPPKRLAKRYPFNPLNKGRGRFNKFKALIPVVLQLRDIDHLTFTEIARRLRVGWATVARAYEAGHPELLEQAIANGGPIIRDPKRAAMTSEEVGRLKEMIHAKKATKEIAAAIGCSEATVYWYKRRC